MKKIHLTDGMPTDIRAEDQPEEVKELTKEILEVSIKSGLSYTDMNKALYLADKGLYKNTINKPRIKDKVFDGKKTLNEMRVEQGLDKVDDPAFDLLLKQMD